MIECFGGMIYTNLIEVFKHFGVFKVILDGLANILSKALLRDRKFTITANDEA